MTTLKQKVREPGSKKSRISPLLSEAGTKEYVLHQAREQGVRFIRLWFSDILGFLKSFAITVDEL